MPRSEEDQTPKGQSYGAESEQQNFRAQAAKPVAPQFDMSFGEVPPQEQITDEGPAPEELAHPDMEIPGLGNLGEIMFGNTDRPDESPNTAPKEWQGPSWAEDGPHGPSQEYLQMLHDPGVDVRTKTLIDLVSRMNILRPEIVNSKFMPTDQFVPAPPAE